jgi:hypothetical protein
MTNIEEKKVLLREKLKSFKEGTDYVISVEIDAWEGKIKNYTVFSPKLKEDLKEIFPSTRN